MKVLTNWEFSGNPGRWIACCGAGLLLAATNPVAAAASSTEKVADENSGMGYASDIRGEMRGAFDAIAYLVEAALSPDGGNFSSEEVQSKLDQLEGATRLLKLHGLLRPASFGLFGRSLEENVIQMTTNYRAGLHQVAELYLLDTIEHCVACHAQQPDNKIRHIGDDFASSLENAEITSPMAARLLIAARQMPRAMEVWENYFSSNQFSPVDLTAEYDLIDYLWHMLHLTTDIQRVKALLENIGNAENVPFYLSRRLSGWVNQLDELGPELGKPTDMAALRQLITDGRGYRSVISGGDQLIRDIVVSSKINGLLDKRQPLERQELAELYYVLATIHLRHRSLTSAVPSAELYLEAAIREAPGSEIARVAYAELERYALQYFGELDPAPDAFPVPLRELRRLADL